MPDRKHKDRKEVFNPFRKKPDYYYCFLGELIFREWKIRNGLSSYHAKCIIIASYYIYLKQKDYKYWLFELKLFKKTMGELVAMGYMTQTEVVGTVGHRKCKAWILTKKGKDFLADFEQYYDTRFKEVQQRRFGIFIDFKDGKPFRRIKKKKHEMEYKTFKDNGDPKKMSIMDMWKDLDYDES